MRKWIESWNSHDLERILAHYTDDLEISSPLITERLRVAREVLKGKSAVRDDGMTANFSSWLWILMMRPDGGDQRTFSPTISQAPADIIWYRPQ